jgi:hypothetical protein
MVISTPCAIEAAGVPSNISIAEVPYLSLTYLNISWQGTVMCTQHAGARAMHHW